MADLEITEVSPVEIVEQSTAPAEAALDVGAYVKHDATTGRWEACDASAEATLGNRPGVTLKEATYAGEAVTVVHRGVLFLGDALDGLDFDDLVYASDTAGALADAAGTVEEIVGVVVPIFGETTPAKALYVAPVRHTPEAAG